MQLETKSLWGFGLLLAEAALQDCATELDIPKPFESYEATLMINNKCCLYSFSNLVATSLTKGIVPNE